MQQSSRGPPRQLVSPLPSPALSSTESSFSISKYAHGPGQGRTGQPYSQPPQRVPVTTAPSRSDRPGVPDSGAAARDASLSPDPEGSMASERVARTHWQSFRLFLGDDVEQDHARQNKAREKLTRLSRTQFQELSTDVYDEVSRRTREAQAGQDALPADPAFHPKRNQAREKLASLQLSRFKYLASDVFFEIERRYPRISASRNDQTWTSSAATSPRRIDGAETTKAGASKDLTLQNSTQRQPNTFRQTAMIPNKSTMIEEDLDSDYESDLKSHKPDADFASVRSSEYEARSFPKQSATSSADSKRSTADSDTRVNELLAKISVLELELKQKTQDPSAARQMKRDMGDLLEQNDKLEEELASLKSGKSGGGDDALRAENESLKSQLIEQQNLTEEVRSEAEGFLNEMRELSDRETTVYERSEALQEQVHLLEGEVREWKDRYQKVKTQLRQVKATSQFFSPAPNLRAGEGNSFVAMDGVIRDVGVTRFQISIDSLLRTARINTPALLDSMKDVILATQSIQKDLSSSTAPIVQDTRVRNLCQRMSNTLSNLMTACKNHMSGGPLSPVSLVDAAASHLSSTIIELAKICQLKPSSVNSEEEQDNGEEDGDEASETVEQSYGTLPRQNGSSDQARSTPESDASFLSPPIIGHRGNDKRQGSSFNGKGLTIQIPTNEPKEDVNEQLRSFLEMQTEGIVSSIQNLLSAIRADARSEVLQTHMGEIVRIVTLVTSSMREAFSTSKPLRTSTGGIVELLESCTARIRNMEASVPRGSEQATKEFKQKLAGIAYDTAQQTKELSLVLHNEEEAEVDLT